MNPLFSRAALVAKAIVAVIIPIVYSAGLQIATDLSVSEDPIVALIGLALLGSGVWAVPNKAPDAS